MARFNPRHLEEEFFQKFQPAQLAQPEGKFYGITQIVREDPYLNFEMRGSSVMIYYRGGKLLSINTNDELEGLDPKYSKDDTVEVPQPELEHISEYIDQAKHIIDKYENEIKDHLGEKEIQQRVVFENNLSVNAANTDFFIVDTEWADVSLGGRADIMAFRWLRSSRRRKNEVQLTLIEVKQGTKSFKGDAGLQKHISDYEKLAKDPEYVKQVGEDMLEILIQKHKLKLIKGLDDYLKNDKRPGINPNVDFIFLLANYHPYSSILAQTSESLPANSKFFISSFMGYGLYYDFVKTKDELVSMFPDVFSKLKNKF